MTSPRSVYPSELTRAVGGMTCDAGLRNDLLVKVL